MQRPETQDSQQNSNVKLISQLRHAIYNLSSPEKIKPILQEMTLEDIEIAWTGGRKIQEADRNTAVSIKPDAIGAISGSALIQVAQHRKVAQHVKKFVRSADLPNLQVNVSLLEAKYRKEAEAIIVLVQEQLKMSEKIAGTQDRVAARLAYLNELKESPEISPITSSTPSLFSAVVNTLANWWTNVANAGKAFFDVLAQIGEAIIPKNEDTSATRADSIPEQQSQGRDIRDMGSHGSTMDSAQASMAHQARPSQGQASSTEIEPENAAKSVDSGTAVVHAGTNSMPVFTQLFVSEPRTKTKTLENQEYPLGENQQNRGNADAIVVGASKARVGVVTQGTEGSKKQMGDTGASATSTSAEVVLTTVGGAIKTAEQDKDNARKNKTSKSADTLEVGSRAAKHSSKDRAKTQASRQDEALIEAMHEKLSHLEKHLVAEQAQMNNKVPEVKARGLWQKEVSSTMPQTRISNLQREITALHGAIDAVAQQSRAALEARDKTKYQKASTDFYEIDKKITALDQRVHASVSQSTTAPAPVAQLRK